MNNKIIGILAILGASVMWAIEPIFGKLSYSNSDFLHTSAIRAFFVVLTAFVYILFTNFFVEERSNLKTPSSSSNIPPILINY